MQTKDFNTRLIPTIASAYPTICRVVIGAPNTVTLQKHNKISFTMPARVSVSAEVFFMSNAPVRLREKAT
jgi:hypothetical protein